MKSNDNKKISIILVLMIIILFSILFYSWLEVFGIIGENNKTTISILLDETVNIIPDHKKIVVNKKDDYGESISVEEKEKILEGLRVGEENKVIEEKGTELNDYRNIDTSRFYYNQINDVAKIIYDNIYKNKDNIKTGTYKIEFGDAFSNILKQDNGTEVIKEAYSQAIRSFLFDNPSIFFLDVAKMSLVTETKTSLFSKEYNVNIIPPDGGSYLAGHFSSEAIVNSEINNINKIVNQIKIKTEGYSEVDKIKYVHDYLVKNIEYDSTLEKRNIYNIYGALISNVAVCEGYAKSFKYILDELGIPSIIVLGTAINVENVQEKHSWNYVYIDGKWYGVDSTFDDPIVIGGPSGFDNTRYTYYLKGSNKFSTMHNIDPMEILGFYVKYPELEIEDYN